MGALTERLEVRLPAESLRQLREEAQRRRVSMGDLVRQAISALFEQDQQARVEAAHDLFRVGAPVSNWDEMKREIEQAHLQASVE